MPYSVSKKRMKKYIDSLDYYKSHIRSVSELNGIYFGEVRGIHDCACLGFVIQKGIISVSDFLDPKQCKFNFTYDMNSCVFKGKGTRHYQNDCERYIGYILILLDNFNNLTKFRGVH